MIVHIHTRQLRIYIYIYILLDDAMWVYHCNQVTITFIGDTYVGIGVECVGDSSLECSFGPFRTEHVDDH